MAGMLERLRRLRDQTVGAESERWPDALTVAYQQGLSWLQQIRQEAEVVASRRRRLAVGSGAVLDPDVRAQAQQRDAALAIEHRDLLAAADVLRSDLEQLRMEREAILALPDPELADRRAKAVLARWRTEPDRLVQRLGMTDEPGGYVTDDELPTTYEQPPGWRG